MSDIVKGGRQELGTRGGIDRSIHAVRAKRDIHCIAEKKRQGQATSLDPGSLSESAIPERKKGVLAKYAMETGLSGFRFSALRSKPHRVADFRDTTGAAVRFAAPDQ